MVYDRNFEKWWMKMSRIKKVLLLFPPGVQIVGEELKKCTPPLGISYLGAYLEQQGYDVKLIDAIADGYDQELIIEDGVIQYGMSDQKIEWAVRDFQPDVVGISCIFSSLAKTVIRLAKIAKNINPTIITIVGGAHPTIRAGEMLTSSYIDFVVHGEGEVTLANLLQAINECGNGSKVDGVSYKDSNGKNHNNPAISHILDLDVLPFPARHLLPMKKYSEISRPHGHLLKTPFASMITSRGCPANCSFCSVRNIWGNSYRVRSPENVLNEIETLISSYGIKEIHFEDDNLTANKKRAIRIFKGIVERNFDIVWNTPNGVAVWNLDEELLDNMKQSGCYSISLAIESGDQDVLTHLINKPLKLNRVRRIVSSVKSRGIHVTGFFVIGFPGETLDQMRRTIEYSLSLNLDNLAVMIATPYPGTKLYNIVSQNKFFSVDESELDYIKVRHSKGAKGVIKTPDFTPEDVAELLDEYKADIENNNNLTYRDHFKAIWNVLS